MKMQVPLPIAFNADYAQTAYDFFNKYGETLVDFHPGQHKTRTVRLSFAHQSLLERFAKKYYCTKVEALRTILFHEMFTPKEVVFEDEFAEAQYYGGCQQIKGNYIDPETGQITRGDLKGFYSYNGHYFDRGIWKRI